MSTVVQTIQAKFPGVPIINAIGNNDILNKNQAPTTAQKVAYYTDMFDMWFNSVAANKAASNIANI